MGHPGSPPPATVGQADPHRTQDERLARSGLKLHQDRLQVALAGSERLPAGTVHRDDPGTGQHGDPYLLLGQVEAEGQHKQEKAFHPVIWARVYTPLSTCRLPPSG